MSSHLPSILPVAPSEAVDEGRVFMGRRYRNDPYKAKVMDEIVPVAPSVPVVAPAASHFHQLGSGNFGSFASDSSFAMPSVQVGVSLMGPSSRAMKPPAPPGGRATTFPRTLSPLPSVTSITQDDIEVDVDGETGGFSGVADIRFKLFKGQHAVPKYLFDVLRAGDMVVVEGDRGEDIGIVEACTEAPADRPLPPVPVLRLANATDRHRYNAARSRELEVLPHVIECVSEVGLDTEIRIRDIEFQADLQKLTIVFDPMTRKKKRVDFRELQRAVFKLVKCRIWLLNSIELRGR